jgi:riboflavin synthase
MDDAAMFTGIVEETGRVMWLRRSSQSGLQIQVSAPLISRGLRLGDSVALNGCCLTVAAQRGEFVTFDLLQETLDRTNLHRQRPGAAVNLERALPANGRLDGHFVQGHVDCTSRVEDFAKKGDDYRLEVALPQEMSQLVVFKGSIAINGISLTVASLNPESFTVWIIPHTREQTNLHDAVVGDLVNLEFDILAKYVERILGRSQLPPPHLTDRDLS